MSLTDNTPALLRHVDRFFTVAEAHAAGMSRAVAAAREAFDTGP
jgi:hypothetical protein